MKRLVVTFFLVVMVTAVWTAPALADTGHGPRIKTRNGSSTNWSGYAAQTSLASPQNNAVSDVKGSWTVPLVSGGVLNTYSSTWVGIDGYSDGTVEQIGVEQDWTSGASRYYAWYEMYPKFPVLIRTVPVRAGDVIAAEVQYTGNSRFVLTIKNLTTNQSYSTVQKARANRSSAEWIEEAPSSSGGVLPLANFGTVNFSASSATINGHTGTISDSAWKFDAITMVNRTGGIKAVPSALSTDGSAFGVTWQSS